MKHSPEFEALVDEARARVVEVTTAELRARQQADGGPRVFDVREDHEVAQGRIVGAEHLGRGILERDIVGRVPDKDTEIVLYCGGGYRSALAADSLQRMGYRRVRSLAGGWRAWTAQGLPTET